MPVLSNRTRSAIQVFFFLDSFEGMDAQEGVGESDVVFYWNGKGLVVQADLDKGALPVGLHLPRSIAGGHVQVGGSEA